MPEVGTIVQVTPEHSKRWGACLVIVTEVKRWGIQGYVVIPSQGDAYLRLKTGEFETCGTAVWMRE